MTGGAERVAHIKFPPPHPASVPRFKHTSWYMSDDYICLQYLFFLSLIFRLRWLWRNRELVWDIIRGKFAKQLLSVFFLPNEVSTTSTRDKGQSICSVLVNRQNHEVVRVGLSLVHFDPFCFWLFWCLISRYFKAVGCFWQSKNTISFIYTVPNCTEEQQYIILLWSTILWNFNFHWQLSTPPPATGLLSASTYHFGLSDKK